MKSRITQVNYGRTINVGNYESVRIDLTAEVPQGEDWRDVLEDLRDKMFREEKLAKKQGF